MKIGAIFPQDDIGNDPLAIRDFAQAAESLGYDHLLATEHVLGADPTNRPANWRGLHHNDNPYHEPFVLFGYLAAVTQRIGFATDVVVLPQRQTVLVAKQAAEVDVLSGGRLRLGVGVGWNNIEFEALNERWTNRGKRIEEQVELLRTLWTNELVDYTGHYHRIDRAGILPLPVQRPIPIWMGGMTEPVLKRTARMADGWYPPTSFPPAPAGEEMIARLHSYAREAGRDPASIGIEARIQNMGDRTPDDWRKEADEYRRLGATHLGFGTDRSGLTTPREHLDSLRRFRESGIIPDEEFVS